MEKGKKRTYRIGMRLIRASNTLQARGFVAKDTIKVTLATQEDMYEMAKKGVEIEDAVAEKEPA